MSSMLQVRIDDELKNQATIVYEQLGIDLSTAVRMFLKKSVAINGVPFEMKNDSSLDKAYAALNSMRNTSIEKGNNTMSLDEINGIIKNVRLKKHK